MNDDPLSQVMVQSSQQVWSPTELPKLSVSSLAGGLWGRGCESIGRKLSPSEAGQIWPLRGGTKPSGLIESWRVIGDHHSSLRTSVWLTDWYSRARVVGMFQLTIKIFLYDIEIENPYSWCFINIFQYNMGIENTHSWCFIKIFQYNIVFSADLWCAK